MLWKILSGLAAIALAVGVWFSIQNKEALKTEKELDARATSNLTEATDALTTGATKKAAREKELTELEKQRDTVMAEVNKATTDKDQKVQEAETIKTNLDEVTKQLTALEDQINKAGDIERLLVQVKDLNDQKKAKEADVANEQQKLALSDDKLVRVASAITRLEDEDKRQRSGIVEPGFTARISQPYLGFGFVILNKGNLGGMFANAMLDVKRGNRVVARLKVRDVEQSMSVADLVPGTLRRGDSIRSGDLVVAAKMPAPPPTPEPVATPDAPATTNPAGDPFGGGMAPPTPAAPDPFGGGMAPAAPAAADPFGGAPAPAPAGGMAPAGEPAAPAAPPATPPATPDPFAPPQQN